MRALLGLCLILLLTACGAYGPERAAPQDIAALSAEIRALAPEIDPIEAATAARLAYNTSYALARSYQITDPPLIHNAKVNAGLRPRGLCYHWAEDLQARLEAEGFETLGIERAIANADNSFLIDHSTAVIVARGAPMISGIVIDPWRNGGRLFWAPAAKDPRYDWQPRLDVLRKHGRIIYVQRGTGSLAPPPVQ